MPFVSETSASRVLEDGYSGDVYHYAKMTVTVSTSGDTVSYTATTNSCYAGSSQSALSFYLKIGDTVVYDGYYQNWGKFPNKAGTSASGSVTVSANNTSIPVDFRLLTAQSWQANAVPSRFWDGTAKVAQFNLTRTYYTDMADDAKVSVTDNKNNSFTVTGTKCTGGTNNAVKSTGLWVSQTPSGSSWDWGSEDATTLTKTVALSNLTDAATRTCAGYIRCYPTIGSVNRNASRSGSVNQYRPPSGVKNIELTPNSFKNNRLTIKQNWTYSWDPAEPANANSPVAGHRIRIYKNGALVKGVVVGSGSTVTKGTGTNEWIDRDGGTNCSVTFNPGPSGFDFKPGDTVKISVFAYAKNGLGQITWYVGSTYYHLWSGNGSTPVESAESTVQNSGIMRVRPAGSWQEGVVWVKVNNAWVEAEVVYAKDSNNWKEST